MCTCILLLHLGQMRRSSAWELLLRDAWHDRGGTKRLRVSNQGLVHLAWQLSERRHSSSTTALPFKHLRLAWNLDACSRFHGCSLAEAHWTCEDAQQLSRWDAAPSQTDAELFGGAMHANCPWNLRPGGTESTRSDLGRSKTYSAQEEERAFPTDDLLEGDKWRGFGRYVRLVRDMPWSAAMRAVSADSGKMHLQQRCILSAEVQCT